MELAHIGLQSPATPTLEMAREMGKDLFHIYVRVGRGDAVMASLRTMPGASHPRHRVGAVFLHRLAPRNSAIKQNPEGVTQPNQGQRPWNLVVVHTTAPTGHNNKVLWDNRSPKYIST